MATVGAKRIIVSPRQRACINCQHYNQLMREVDVPGEVYKKCIPVSIGWCVRREEQRGPLRQPCKDYENKEG